MASQLLTEMEVEDSLSELSCHTAQAGLDPWILPLLSPESCDYKNSLPCQAQHCWWWWMCVCARACTWEGVCSHVHTWEHQKMSCPITISFSTLFPGGNVSQRTGAMWTGSKSQRSSCPTLQHEDYITGIHTHAKIFMWVLWSQTQVLMHAQQMLFHTDLRTHYSWLPLNSLSPVISDWIFMLICPNFCCWFETGSCSINQAGLWLTASFSCHSQALCF